MINYDRATTKLLWGIPPELEYGRWNGTFANGVTSWRRLVQQRITGGTLNTLRILVVGCGIGLMVEGLRAEGFSRAWGIGLNDYFATLWDQATCPVMTDGGIYIDPITRVESAIAPGAQWPCEVNGTLRPLLGTYDIRTMTPTNINTLTSLTGAQRSFDLIITEDVCTAYTLAELQAPANATPPGIYASCDRLLAGGGQVRHMVSLGSDLTPWGGSPVRTLAEWTATLGGRTNHQFQDIAGVTA